MPDFSLLGQGPQFQNILSAYDAGRTARKEMDTKNALALYATDPEGGIAAINKVDPILGFKLRDDYTARRSATERRAAFSEPDPSKRREMATATGDPETIAAVMKLDADARAQKKEATEAVGGFAFGLKRVPYEQRKAMIQQNAAGLQEAGFSPESLSAFDPTDANLDGVVAQMQTLDQAFKFADQEADNRREKEKADEAVRHNREMEGIGRQNAESSRIRANRPPASSTGSSSGLPAGFVLDR